MQTRRQFLGSVTALAAVRAAAEEKRGLDVLSFNIRCGTAKDGADAWANRRALVAALLQRRDPDLVGLQEALRFQLDFLRAACPGYAEIGEGRDGGTRGEYSAILYRAARFEPAASGTFWLSDSPEKPSADWGNRCLRICTWARLVDRADGRAFYLFNTHLDHESQPSREKSVRLIAERIARRSPADPFLVTGDFNAAEDNPAIRYLKGKLENAPPPVIVTDTFRTLHPDARDVRTFHGFRGGAAGNKIDYVLAGPGFDVQTADIVRDCDGGRYPSDHYPVAAHLRW